MLCQGPTDRCLEGRELSQNSESQNQHRFGDHTDKEFNPIIWLKNG